MATLEQEPDHQAPQQEPQQAPNQEPQQEPQEEVLIVGQMLQADSQEGSDVDSAIGDSDRDTISTSLTSSVAHYRHEHGRRYHAFSEDAYWLPNDDIEIERLDIQHHVWRLTLNGRLHISPVPADVQDVLDIGTGTGQWAVEFADLHPSARVLGTDLSPIQPDWVPPNCSFIIDNAENDWVYNRKFDFIHSRMLLMGIHDWPRYFRQTWDNLSPGGWMEVQEVQSPICFADDTVPPDSPFLVWSQHIAEAAAKANIDTLVTEKFDEYLVAQGFINIRKEAVQWAVGPWPKGSKEKNIGRWTLENTKQFVSAPALALFTKHLGWSREEVEVFLINVRKDLDDRKKHYFWQIYLFSAQKPKTVTDTEPETGPEINTV